MRFAARPGSSSPLVFRPFSQHFSLAQFQDEEEGPGKLGPKGQSQGLDRCTIPEAARAVGRR